MSAVLYLFHDPMCSWCWAYRPVSDRLAGALPVGVELQKVVGGLAPDNDQPMPPDLASMLQQTWQRIHQLLGTDFNFEFWTRNQPRRSTWPACRAVIAADCQGQQDAMIDAIQRAYYLRAMNPSDLEILEQLAAEIGLDVREFAADIRSSEVDSELARQVDMARRAPLDGFPALVLETGGRLLPVRRDYGSHESSIDHVRELLDAAA